MAETSSKAPEVQADPRVAELEAELAALRAEKAAREQADAEAAAAPAPTEQLDETIPGGLFVFGKDENGKPIYRNANGDRIDAKGKILEKAS